MDFILMGFHEEHGSRLYAFEGVSDDRTRRQFTVTADLEILRKYRIAVQELPLLCRRLLEKAGRPDTAQNLNFTEDLMREYADQCAASKREAELKRRPHRRPHSTAIGQAWRAGAGAPGYQPTVREGEQKS